VGEAIERYVDDQDDVLLDFLDSDGDGNGATIAKRYLHGAAVDQILAQEDVDVSISAPGRVLWHLADNLGTVRALAENDGDVVEHIQYNAFGKAATPSAVTRYQFTGREFDAGTGLQYNRARWYDSAVGRWISEDPLGYEDGVNLYVYCGNDPIGAVDPQGTVQATQLTQNEMETCCVKSLATKPELEQAGTRGWLTCCKGQKIICVNGKLLPPPPPRQPGDPVTASELFMQTLRDCVAVHESQHIQQTVSCDDPRWNEECLPFADPSKRDAYECGAYQAEIDCLWKSIDSLPANMNERENLTYRQLVRAKAIEYAANAQTTYNCNPPLRAGRPRP
jgi:RHS repeat-associated protein